jgi:hypothetical protein
MSIEKNRRKKSKQKTIPTKNLPKTGLIHRLLSHAKYFYAALGVLITVHFFWPRISVSPSVAWDSSNPIQSTFTIKNDSNIMCYAIKYDIGTGLTVHSDLTFNGPEMSGVGQEIPKLCPNEGSTISIEKIVTTSPNAIDEAEIYINLTYSPTFIHLN